MSPEATRETPAAPPQPGRFRSIRSRVSVMSCVVIAITILLFALSVVPYLEQLLVDRLTKTGEVVATSIAQVTVTSVVVEDYSAVIDHCVRVVKDRASILYIVITRKDGFSLVSEENGWRSRTLGGEWLPDQEGGRFTENEFTEGAVYQYSHHLVYSGIDWGWIHIGLSTEQFDQDLKSVYIRVSAIAALCVLAGWVIAAFFGRRLTSPLLSLNQTTQRIEAGDLSARADIHTGDEVEYLAHSVNRMASELIRSRESLEERVNERTAELRSANQRLISEVEVRRRAEEGRAAAEKELEEQRALSMRSDRLRSLGEMAAGIAHELNQPLVAVRGAAEHMMIGIEEGWEVSGDRLTEKLERIVDQADRMVHIIEHVRMFAREAGKPEMETVQTNDVAQSTVDLLGAQFRSNGVDLSTELEENLPVVQANPFSLEEVVINLLNNARDAVTETRDAGSGGRVVIRTRRHANGQGDAILLEVEDEGSGIPEDILARIWDPFFTTKDPDKGTGLGLSIARTIVEEFGGELSLESKVGKGTTARVSLPVSTVEEDG